MCVSAQNFFKANGMLGNLIDIPIRILKNNNLTKY